MHRKWQSRKVETVNFRAQVRRCAQQVHWEAEVLSGCRNVCQLTYIATQILRFGLTVLTTRCVSHWREIWGWTALWGWRHCIAWLVLVTGRRQRVINGKSCTEHQNSSTYGKYTLNHEWCSLRVFNLKNPQISLILYYYLLFCLDTKVRSDFDMFS